MLCTHSHWKVLVSHTSDYLLQDINPNPGNGNGNGNGNKLALTGVSYIGTILSIIGLIIIIITYLGEG